MFTEVMYANSRSLNGGGGAGGGDAFLFFSLILLPRTRTHLVPRRQRQHLNDGEATK